MSTETLQQIVHRNLDNALDNGYDLKDMTAEQIALDMLEFSAEVEDLTEAELIPHIQSWFAKV